VVQCMNSYGRQKRGTGCADPQLEDITLYQVPKRFPLTISCLEIQPTQERRSGRIRFAPTTRAAVFSVRARQNLAMFNPAAFSTPAAFTFGNVGRKTVFGPGVQTMDIDWRDRSHPRTRSSRMRAEAYNALNHSNFGTRTAR